MDQAVEAMKAAYAALSSGQAQVPQRVRLEIPPHAGLSLFMPSYVQDPSGDALAVKVVSVYSANPQRGLPLIFASVLVLDPETGRTIALLEGSSLTAMRTGAASGAATDILARADSQVAALFGAGTQGRTQLEAVCTVRSIETAWVYDVDPENVRRFISEISGACADTGGFARGVQPRAGSAGGGYHLHGDDIHDPGIFRSFLESGCAHQRRRFLYTLKCRSCRLRPSPALLLIVDSRSASLAETGDLLVPIQEGRFTASHIHAELGELILGRVEGRTSPDQITLFKSVGVAVQDAMAARLALHNAQIMGLGQIVEF